MKKGVLSIELHSVKREIKIHGNKYTFYRDNLDSYGENADGKNIVANVNGLFHVSKGYISKNVSDGAVTHSKGQPMLLITYEDSKDIKSDDYVIIGENKYKVIEKNNIQQYNIVVDVSLELVLNGNN